MNEVDCSVIVMTYNSSDTIIETLNSILDLKYDLKKLEIIISDDCSSDSTNQYVDEWLENNRNLFYASSHLISIRNFGICNNLNKGVNVSRGKWLKLIAGDDKLMPTFLVDNFKYCDENPDAKIVFSSVVAFDSNTGKELYNLPDSIGRKYFSYDSNKQFEMLLFECFPPAPSVLISKDLIKGFGLFDEDFLSEDHQTWLKLTKAGVRLHFINVNTVYYRKNDSSITSSKINVVSTFNRAIKDELYEKIISKYSKSWFVGLNFYYEKIIDVIIIFFGNKGLHCRLLKFLKKFAPYYIIRKVKKEYEEKFSNIR